MHAPGGVLLRGLCLNCPPALTDGARDPRMPDPGDVPVIAVPRNPRLLTASSLHAVVGMVSVETLNLLDCCPAVLCPSRPLLLLPLPSHRVLPSPTQTARIGTPNHKALALLVWGWHRVRARPSWCRQRRDTAISTQRHNGPRSNTHRPAVATAGAMMGMGARRGARGRFVVFTGGI